MQIQSSPSESKFKGGPRMWVSQAPRDCDKPTVVFRGWGFPTTFAGGWGHWLPALGWEHRCYMPLPGLRVFFLFCFFPWLKLLIVGTWPFIFFNHIGLYSNIGMQYIGPSSLYSWVCSKEVLWMRETASLELNNWNVVAVSALVLYFSDTCITLNGIVPTIWLDGCR